MGKTFKRNSAHKPKQHGKVFEKRTNTKKFRKNIKPPLVEEEIISLDEKDQI